MKKILVIGDYMLATWHPLRGVDDELVRILSDYDITICEEYQKLTMEQLNEYAFVINYIDAYNSRVNVDLAALFIAYIALGGVMMVVHNGIIARRLPELEQMFGGAFTHHPKHELLKYTLAQSHPLGKTLKSFEIDEEPYMFTMSNLASTAILMEYEYKQQKYPAVWVRNFARGRILYIAPGHNADAFRNEGMQILIRQGARWCAGEMDFCQDNIYGED